MTGFQAFGLLTWCAVAVAGAVIDVPREADPVTRFAGQELARYLNAAAGTDGLTIRVGHPWSFDADAAPETFVVAGADGAITLAGKTPRATLYAVYSFLQDPIGWNWFYPGEDIPPDADQEGILQALTAFAASGQTRIEAPDFPVRMRRFLVYDLGRAGAPLANRAMEDLLLEIDWMAKNRMNILQFGIDHNFECHKHWQGIASRALEEMGKRGIVPALGGHNMHMFMRTENLKAHPDWQPFYRGKRQLRGQFCTSNEEAVRHYLDRMVAFLNENPGIRYFALWPNDMGGWCECEKCKDTPSADRFMKLGKRIYHELREKRPNVQVTHFAYGSHMAPPKTERPDQGMTITLCMWGRNLQAPFDSDGTSRSFRRTFAAWRDICDEASLPLILHEKYARHLYLGHHTMPLPILQEDLRWFKGQGLDGFELPMGYMGRRVRGLNLYVLARLMWDVDAPVAELLDDHFARSFGPTATEIRRAYERVERAMHDYRYSFQNQCHALEATKPGEPGPPGFSEYADGVLRAVAAALRMTDSASASLAEAPIVPFKREAILTRIGLFQHSLEYLQTEWEGASAFAAGAKAGSLARSPKSQGEYADLLDEAKAQFERSRLLDEARQRLAGNIENLPLYWDVLPGGPSYVYAPKAINGWREWIEQRRGLDITQLQRTVWQIGAFDGNSAELASGADLWEAMGKFPRVVRYEIPEDWRERADWLDFPRSHWPRRLDHAARIELVFPAEPGSYRLVVGQISTGEPETVPVLLDGEKVGEYTTVAGSNATHEVNFRIEEAGAHELVLGEFDDRGGYNLDAIRLVRLPEPEAGE